MPDIIPHLEDIGAVLVLAVLVLAFWFASEPSATLAWMEVIR